MRGIEIDGIHTGNDWGIMLTAKSLLPPETKTHIVEIEGADGNIDLTESLTNDVKYNNRVVEFTFIDYNDNYNVRCNRLTEIIAYVHGKQRQVIIDDDTTHYFSGRWSIAETEQNNTYTSFKIIGDCKPWKYAINKKEILLVASTEEKQYLLNNAGTRLVNPTFKVIGNISITVDNTTLTGLTAGEYINTDILLRHGDNPITISGNGRTIVTYQEAVI